MIRHTRVTATLLLALACSACATLRGYSGSGAQVHIANDSGTAVSVSAVGPGHESDLGTVAVGAYELFELPSISRGEAVRYVVRAASPQAQFETDTITVTRGMAIGVRLAPRLSESRWSAF